MKNHNNSGFTLTEIMVALAILAIAIAGITITFKSQTKSFSLQEQVSSMQMSGSLALSRIAQEVRMAGYGVAAGANAISAFTDGASGAPDTFTIVANLNASAFTSQLIGSGSVDIFLTDVTPFQNVGVGTALTILDPLRASVTTATFSSYDETNSKIVVSAGLSASIPEGAYVGVNAQNITYSINNTDPVHPFLSRNGEVLAENVEDLQVAYGEDTNLDGNVESWGDTPANIANVIAVRISIVSRSKFPEQGASNHQVAGVENGSAHGPDGYRRRVYTTTVKLRNVLI